MPFLECVQVAIDENESILRHHYTWEKVSDPLLNPLYAASENVTEELLRCPDKLTNETQLRPLFENSNTPFIVFRRVAFNSNLQTPSKRGRNTEVVTPSSGRRDKDLTPTNITIDFSPRKKVRKLNIVSPGSKK